MGWVWLIVIGAAAAGALALLGVGRGFWSLVGAALMLGATGYALQGRPGEAGSPAEANAERIEIDPGIVKLRGAMMGNFTAETPYLAASDAMLRSGAPDAAAAVMLGGIRKMPNAFRRAMALAPKHPGPPFFLGLAYVRAGEFAEARPFWARALDLTPGDASYRPEIAVRLMLLDRFLAVANGEQAPE